MSPRSCSSTASQVLARYPNFDPKAKYFDGYAADAISKERAARWADPAGGYFHAMHPAMWGGFTWRITGKNATGEITKEGGWQNNRGGVMHPTIRFVENIFEELDAPGEWFFNRRTHALYFYPPAGLDLSKATMEATRLTTLIELSCSGETCPIGGAEGYYLPARESYGHGDEGAALADRLGDLSWRRAFCPRHRRLPVGRPAP